MRSRPPPSAFSSAAAAEVRSDRASKAASRLMPGSYGPLRNARADVTLLGHEGVRSPAVGPPASVVGRGVSPAAPPRAPPPDGRRRRFPARRAPDAGRGARELADRARRGGARDEPHGGQPHPAP